VRKEFRSCCSVHRWNRPDRNGFNLKFTNKLWNYIKKTVDELKNSYTKPTLPTESQDNESLQILKRRLASGEITKEEFEDLKSALE